MAKRAPRELTPEEYDNLKAATGKFEAVGQGDG